MVERKMRLLLCERWFPGEPTRQAKVMTRVQTYLKHNLFFCILRDLMLSCSLVALD